MNLNENLKNYLGDGYYIGIDPIIVERLGRNGKRRQETMYTVKKIQDDYVVSIKDRGTEEKIFSFHKEINAYFYLGLQCKYNTNMIPQNDEIARIDFSTEDDINNTVQTIEQYINSQYFSIEFFKNNAICFIEEDNRYSVYYIDQVGNKLPITLNRDKYGFAMGVLFNFAWKSQWFDKQLEDWEINPEDVSILKACFLARGYMRNKQEKSGEAF